jgi:hypothetical protein
MCCLYLRDAGKKVLVLFGWFFKNALNILTYVMDDGMIDEYGAAAGIIINRKRDLSKKS